MPLESQEVCQPKLVRKVEKSNTTGGGGESHFVQTRKENDDLGRLFSDEHHLCDGCGRYQHITNLVCPGLGMISDIMSPT